MNTNTDINEPLNDQILPTTDLMSEKALLGSLLIDNSKITPVSDLITSADFYDPRHGILYDTIIKLHASKTASDPVTVLSTPDVQTAGITEGYIRELLAYAPNSARALDYAGVVYEKSKLREIERETARLSAEVMRGTSLNAILEDTEKTMLKLTRSRKTQEIAPISVSVQECLEQMRKASESKDGITGLSTGFYDYDRMICGLEGGQYVLIAARPSMGKTAFALNVARFNAIKRNIPVLIFSFEMSKTSLTKRLISMESGVDSQKIRTGRCTEEELIDIQDAGAVISQSPIFIDDTSGINITEIRSRARRMKSQYNIGLIIIDYIGLIPGITGRMMDNRNLELTQISQRIKALAMELNVPVLVLSQLSRKVEERTDKRPVLSDLRDSGALEQDADVVTFLYRDEYYNPDTKAPGVTEVITAKQREGRTGIVKLGWQAEYTRLVNLARERKQSQGR